MRHIKIVFELDVMKSVYVSLYNNSSKKSYLLEHYESKKIAEKLAPIRLKKMMAYPSSQFKRFLNDGIDVVVDNLYDKMFQKYYHGDSLNQYRAKAFFGKGESYYKEFIKERLLLGEDVKTGYRTSKMVRGYRTYYIFYK